MANFTKDNIYKIEKWVEYMNSGHYGNSKDIVDTYNQVFDGVKKKQPYTTCGSCLRRCVIQMANALQEYKQTRKKTTTKPKKTIEQ